MSKKDMRSPVATLCNAQNAAAERENRSARRKNGIVSGQQSFFDTGILGTVVLDFSFNAEWDTVPEKAAASQKNTDTITDVTAPESDCYSEADAKDWHVLVEENDNLVKSRLKGIIGVNNNNRDDVLQAGRIALMQAAKYFDPNRGVKFSSYAVPAIDRAMIREQRRLHNFYDVQSLEEMHESNSCSLIKVVDPFEETPLMVTEKDEIVDVLLNVAESLSRVKEKKGVKALARKLQGYSTEAIAKEAGIAPQSYAALVSAGRRVLQNNPRLLKFVSLIKSKEVEKTTVSLLDEQFTLAFSEDADIDIPLSGDESAKSYLEDLSVLMELDEVADYLLGNVRIGEKVYLIDGDTNYTTSMVMGLDEVTITSLKKIKRALKASA